MAEQREKYNVKFLPSLHTAAKVASAIQRISLEQFIEDAIRKAIPPAFRKGIK